MKTRAWKSYIPWIVLTEVVGGLSGWLTRDGARLYKQAIVKPPLSPPAIVFPVAWAILFALMGISAARVWQRPASRERTGGLLIFFLQLAFNFCWSLIFFNLQRFGTALIWLAVLWAQILWMIITFHRTDRTAAWLQAPYLIWVTFAAYLNAGVWLLN